MKKLKFEHQFAEQIQTGEKTATFRVNDDKDIKRGDIVELVDKVDHDKPHSWQVIGELNITDITLVSLGELTKEDMSLAESFESKQEMIQVFRRFYGDHIDENTQITMLRFTFSQLNEPIKYLQGTTNELKSPVSAKLYADGGSRGNPGPSALGFVVLDESGSVVHSDNKYIGITTNNQAEYHAVIAGLEWCVAQNIRELAVFLDSMLVVNQLKGQFKVKNRDLWSLYESAKELSAKFREFSVTHVPRELNKLADEEVNKALDAVKGSDIVQ